MFYKLIIRFIMERIKPAEINTLSRLFHESLSQGNLKQIEDNIFNNYKIDTLVKTKNKGLISLILQYGVLTNNNSMINEVKPYISMKRDFFTLMVINKSDEAYCKEMFKEKIDFKSICEKDIRFLLDNDLQFLLPLLKGQFINLNTVGTIKDDIRFKKYYLQNTSKYVQQFSKLIKNDIIKSFFETINFDYDYIIDAGNIIFSRNGEFGEHSIQDLEAVVNKFQNNIIIIHQRHLKNKKIQSILDGKKFFATPYNFNDDIFIILCYLKNQVHIVTNDNFKDHTIDENSFRSHLMDSLIKYKNNKGNFTFDEVRPFTRCIQVVDGNTFIPGIEGFECF